MAWGRGYSFSRRELGDEANTCALEQRGKDGEATGCRLCKHCGCMLNTDYVWLCKSGNSDMHVSQKQEIKFVWPKLHTNNSRAQSFHKVTLCAVAVSAKVNCMQNVSSLVRASTPSYRFWRSSLQCVMSMTVYDSKTSFVMHRETSTAQCFSEACPEMRLRLQA